MAIKVKLLVACALGLCLWVGWAGASPADESESEETTTSAEEAVYICPSCHCKIHGTKIHCPICSCPLTGVQPLSDEEQPGPGKTIDTPKSERGLAVQHRISGMAKLGMLIGSQYSAMGTWLTLGVRADTVVFGLGTGYQGYPNGKSTPVFLDIRFDFSKRKVAGYAYIDGGYNIARLKAPFYGNTDASGGIFGFGGGVKLLDKSGFGLAVDGGYRHELSKRYVAIINYRGDLLDVKWVPLSFNLFNLGFAFTY